MTDRLILASASPRRLDLLAQIGIVPDAVIPADINEAPKPQERPRDYVMRMAFEKHQSVISDHPDAFCLAADTAICLGRRILGKPEDEDEARRFLKMLSGRRHRVMTAVVISKPQHQNKPVSKIAAASVKLARMDECAIEDYISTDEWRGKAGGYGIQGAAARYIQWIEGSYTAIVGLPCFEVAQILKGLGYSSNGGSGGKADA